MKASAIFLLIGVALAVLYVSTLDATGQARRPEPLQAGNLSIAVATPDRLSATVYVPLQQTHKAISFIDPTDFEGIYRIVVDREGYLVRCTPFFGVSGIVRGTPNPQPPELSDPLFDLGQATCEVVS